MLVQHCWSSDTEPYRPTSSNVDDDNNNNNLLILNMINYYVRIPRFYWCWSAGDGTFVFTSQWLVTNDMHEPNKYTHAQAIHILIVSMDNAKRITCAQCVYTIKFFDFFFSLFSVFDETI